MKLRGAGGDGGVECFADMPDGGQIGWQAKYVFDIASLLTQAGLSLETALKVHSSLTHYVICFPFDITGPTGRKGRSGQEKLKEWCDQRIAEADSAGRQLVIEIWSEHEIRSLLLDLDSSGGLREFFFNKKILSNGWFKEHLDRAKALAGSRYTPEFNVETELGRWFSAFGRTDKWKDDLEEKLERCTEAYNQVSSSTIRDSSDKSGALFVVADALTEVPLPAEIFHDALVLECENWYDDIRLKLSAAIKQLIPIEVQLLHDFTQEHGANADSPSFRQWMAEYNSAFPASRLDSARHLIDTYQQLLVWLELPNGSLAFTQTFILTGVAGAGKTHSICDIASYRLGHGLLTCVLFGHQFRGEPDPWTRMLEASGLPASLGATGFLDMLEAAAEATNSFLLICIDAVNETRPLAYWREQLLGVIHEVQKRPTLRLCVTCRTAFISSVLPLSSTVPIFEHRGFSGIEHSACNAFFKHYGLEPPLTPVLQPELKNPLYLKLVCETLKSSGMTKMPAGWRGISPTVGAFLKSKEKSFAEEHGVSAGANNVRSNLRLLAQEIAVSGESALSWTRAENIISAKPQSQNLPILEWLIRADLLIEDAPLCSDELYGAESSVRISFERLGDFLVARELIGDVSEAQLTNLFSAGGKLNYLVKDTPTVAENSGVLGALSIIVPESFDGLELPNIINDEIIRHEVVLCTVAYFCWREPNSFSEQSKYLLSELLTKDSDSCKLALETVTSISCEPSTLDALYLNDLLLRYPLAKRDSVWADFLHKQYEAGNSVKQLIEVAFELPLVDVEVAVLERWAIALLWFTASSDRRIRDNATRAVSAILAAKPENIPTILSLFLLSDDDAVKERALLSCYGALIVSQNEEALRTAVLELYESRNQSPQQFDNALIRDHFRCLVELAQVLKVLPKECCPELAIAPVDSKWPLSLPSLIDVERWKDDYEKFPRLAVSCLDNDFFIYSMSCLRDWEYGLYKLSMGKWILQEVIETLGYSASRCNLFDLYMLSNYGGGRGRFGWAERIGKKYQWVSMYRLASKLVDHVERKRDSYDPELQKEPLILLEERQFDPTLPMFISKKPQETDTWWLKPSIYPDRYGHLSDMKWAESLDDIPKLEDLVSEIERNDQDWMLLSSFPTWGHRDRANRDEPYRHVWSHIRSYLVPEEYTDNCYELLHKRNLLGGWMPEGSSWLYGFAGEYPWATPFNTELDSWHATGSYGQFDLSEFFTASSNRLTVEWSNDASLFQPFEMFVPARIFFEAKELWWDGCDGHRVVDGKTVFRDPSVAQFGPCSLLADSKYLLDKLEALGLRLIWTLVGEKLIIGGREAHPSKPIPRRTFSQVARLERDASILFGDQVVFEDYSQDAGPLLDSEAVTNEA
ncbi:MAG: hypothetical protein WA949_21310 [Phormidesmis sp.]